MIVSVSKGQQITIPSKYRKDLNLHVGSKVELIKRGKNIVVKPIDEDLDNLFEQARRIKPKEAFNGQFDKKVKYVQYYSPPAIIHRIAKDMYIGSDPDLVITAVGTAFDSEEEVIEKENYDRSDDNVDEMYNRTIEIENSEPTISKFENLGLLPLLMYSN